MEYQALGVEVLPTARCQLILSDIMMPVMDGYQLLDHLKTDGELNSIPVIMLTARADKDDRLRALRMGVDDYIVKPFVEEELLVRIENLLKHYNERQRHAKAEKGIAKPVAAGDESNQINEEKPEGDISISQRDLEWLEELEERIQTHLPDPKFTQERLASDMALSKRQLHRRIQKFVGLSPNKYIQEIRLNTAREILLDKKESSVKAVSLSIGFKKADYFSNLYYRRFGKRPSEYFG